MAPPPLLPPPSPLATMSGERLLAACGGDGVRLFDAAASMENRPDPCVSHFVPSAGVQVNMVRWNHTNHVLASSGEDRKISLWLKGGKLLGSVPRNDADTGDLMDESILAINFSTKSSRYLCSGGTGKVVRIWDMQRKRCIKWLKGHMDTITGVMYNCKDEHLASINTRGDLIVYSLASGSRVTEVKDPQSQVLRVLEYSRTSRHLLVTAGDDGTVHLWDTTGRQPKMSWFKQHLAPATGACFSPSSEKVVVSVGLDKRLHTFDIGARKPTSTVSGDAPFSSLVFQDDGWTLAAGTNNGRVMFYDIRNKVQPMAVLRAFNPSEAVASLAWQHSNPVPINISNWSPDVALLGSSGNDSVMLPDPLPAPGPRRAPSRAASTPGRPPGSLSVSSIEETPPQAKWSGSGSFMLHRSGVDDMEVFSPLVDVQPIVPPLSTYMDGHKRPSPTSKKIDQWPPSPAGLSTPDMPSPRVADKSPSVTPPDAWGGEIERGTARARGFTSTATTTGSSSREEVLFAGRPTLNDDGFKPDFLRNASDPKVGPDSPVLKNDDQTLANGNFGLYSSPGVNIAQQGRDSSSGNSSSFALQLVQRALEESLGSVQRAIHEDVHNLHVELLRQFHIQHTDLSAMVEKLEAQQAGLMEEVQSLRKENQQLRQLL